ncbi:MAG TPA: SOS response-associated peptidase [Anaerolineae bacterium]|nr:SOS response-associated peptidase [Anaerolineae bacterium]
MCGRFSLWLSLSDLQEAWPDFIFPQEMSPRYNIAPTQPVAVVPNTGDHQVAFFRWGLIPFWAKEADVGNTLFNARAETVANKPAFSAAFKQRRCLVLADGFYEWRAEADGKTKTPMYIRMASGQPFAFAGLWETWGPQESLTHSCTIITTRPNALVAPIHDRMPVILPPEAYAQWLNPATPPFALNTLLKPYPAEPMTAYAVSRLVNSPMNDTPDCIAPAV